MVVCVCCAFGEGQVRPLIERGVVSVDDIFRELADSAPMCGKCLPDLRLFIERTLKHHGAKVAKR